MLRDLGLLLTRSVVGLSFAAHGSQKAFGWFGGPGPAGAAGFMESLGFVPGERYATLSSTGEMVAGTLLALGLGGPLAPGMVAAIMLVAARTAHKDKGYFAQGGGYELAAIYVTSAFALALAGPGKFSLDKALKLDAFADERLAWLFLIGGGVAGMLALQSRRMPDVPSDPAAA